MGYSLDLNDQVRLGMADADPYPPDDRGCMDCGREGCYGDCPEGRAAVAELRTRLADPVTYAEPPF
jgi:hypothetical protein